MSQTKKRRPIKNGILKLVLAIASLTRLTENLVHAVRTRALAAGRSLFALLVLAFLFASMLIVFWLSCLALLYVNLLSQHWTQQTSLFVVIGLNVVLMLVIAFLIQRATRQLDDSFHFRGH